MSMNMLILLPILATAPYAMIETREIEKTDANNFQVRLRAVDGKAYWDGRDEMKITPGFHFVEMTAEKSGMKVAKKNHDKSLYLKAKPCFRYFVSGQVNSALDRDWTVRVLGNERILACKTKEETEQEKIDKKAKAKEKTPKENDS